MSTTPPSSQLRRLTQLGLRLLVAVLLTGAGLWSTMAIYYSNLPATWLRGLASAVYALTWIAVLVRLRPAWRAWLVFLMAFGVVLAWFLLIPPSNERDWQPDVAVLPYAEVNGEQVTIHNIRNCDYRTETDYTVRHYDKTFDLRKLQSADFYVVYWGSPLIAHTMMSFGFDSGDYVCFSIETRKEKGESYSAIKGFFRQFELIYVLGDERDLVRLRTNYRGEQVYLYRLNTDLAVRRLVLLSYLKEVNRLKDRPEWYNAVTANCTTLIRGHTKPYAKNARFDWRMLLNGRIDEMAYERKSLDQSLPFAQLKVRSLINDRAKAADQDSAFSKRIREQLPGVAGAQINTDQARHILVPEFVRQHLLTAAISLQGRNKTP
jgi:uncharacterized protein DUF4105